MKYHFMCRYILFEQHVKLCMWGAVEIKLNLLVKVSFLPVIKSWYFDAVIIYMYSKIPIIRPPFRTVQKWS